MGVSSYFLQSWFQALSVPYVFMPALWHIGAFIFSALCVTLQLAGIHTCGRDMQQDEFVHGQVYSTES